MDIKALLIASLLALPLLGKGGSVPVSQNKKSGDMDKVEPWFTGPLLAPDGHTVPAGHVNIEPYFFWTDQYGTYGHKVQRSSNAATQSWNPLLDFTVGLLSFMDFQGIFQVMHNRESGAHTTRLGDTSLILGFQVANDDPTSGWWPDIRLTVTESFPSGQYLKLNPKKKGTDATGSGSYQTSPGMIIQKLWHVRNYNFLRTRLFLSYTVPSKVHVKGFNTYGGGYGSKASVKPGEKFTGIFAFEYALTRNLVLASDFQFIWAQQNRITVSTGSASEYNARTNSESYQFSVAPALEWNFNENVGLIAGVWLSAFGHDSSDFVSAVIALNIYK